MSSANSIIKSVLNSSSFHNFSIMYLKYIKMFALVGSGIGVTASSLHIYDNNVDRHKFQKRFLKQKGVKSEDELTGYDIEEFESKDSSSLYNFSIIVGGTLGGASLGVMWPAVVVFGPIYYVFGDYLGPIVSTLLTISASIDKRDNE